MSERSFIVGAKNEHGLNPLVRVDRLFDDNGEPYLATIHLGDLTDDELASLEEQAHQRRAEQD